MENEDEGYEGYGGEDFESVNEPPERDAEEMTAIGGADDFQSINEKPKESAAEITAIKAKRGAPKFDRDKVIKMVMVSLGILVVIGVVITNIQRRTEEEAAESRKANKVNVPEDFRRRSLAAGNNDEVAETETAEGSDTPDGEEDVEAEVYGYLPGYGQVKSETSNPAPAPPSSSVPPPPAPRVESGGSGRTGGGAAATPVPAPDPALTAKLIPEVEGNGSVYSGQATAVTAQTAGLNPLGGMGDAYLQAARYLQTAATPQTAYPQTAYPQTAYPQAAYPQAAQYVPPQPSAPYGQSPATPYGQQPANEVSQQGYQTQNMQADKQAFYDGGGGASGGGVLKNGYYIGEDTLWNGTIIPAVLVTGINTDLPGEVMARVSENIYDSLAGKHLLIPQGTILMARYNSSVSYAQGRVQIIWNTLTRPDGYQIELGGMNGVDDRGMSGQRGEYHENWFQYLKAAGIITMFTLANGEMTRAAGGAMANTDVAAANQNIVNQLAGNITARALNIQPTITVKSGEKINVMLNKAVYLPPVEGHKPTERYRR
jgi:type IV secretory pathway VirB10-like protein